MADNPFRRLCIVGLGHVGLPAAALFASREIEVIGVDLDLRIVDAVNGGQVHVAEPGLAPLVRSAVAAGYLRAALRPEAADAFLIAVPTPLKAADRTADLGHVEAAASAIASLLEPGNLVILESTSPVGTTAALARQLAEARPDLTFPHTAGEASAIRIAFCPERVLPGRALHELIAGDRIIGGMTPRCSAAATALYRTFAEGACQIASSDRMAEMVKLAENSFRDVNIAFANEISLVCDAAKLDVWELIRLANRHPRVEILQPGPGAGGHCIAVDPWFVVALAPEETRLIRAARAVNDAKPEWVVAKVRGEIAACLRDDPDRPPEGLTLAVYGLAYKADIDDLRGSPALEIARRLAAIHPGPILIVDPYVGSLPEGLGRARLCGLDAAAAADLHVLLVDHAAFRHGRPAGGRIIDVRGMWTPPG
jgi:UDP-N-acetyl-D-mannosaminuronic acid dehydrogenase